jgi:hypothetical protein
VDPWSHFINVYMLDRNGQRIDRRNPQDIFTPLYNHQIPPGAAAVVTTSSRFRRTSTEPLTVELQVRYRKFDAIYMNYVLGRDYTNGAPLQVTNDLPITVICSDRVTFPVEGQASGPPRRARPMSAIPPWQRWNDYGIGLFLESTDRGSEKASCCRPPTPSAQVEKLGRYDGALNLARVYETRRTTRRDGARLQRAALSTNPPPPRWTIAWFNGRVNKQNGYLDKAITEFRSISKIATRARPARF